MQPLAVRAASSSVMVWILAGCALPPSESGASWRAPGFNAAAVRRPAVLVHISLMRVGFDAGPFSAQERASIPESYEAAVEEALNALAIIPLDVTLEARRSERSSDRPLERLDTASALARARQAGAEHLLIVAARLSRREMVHCRESRRALSGLTTVWEAGLEILRVPDGAPLLIEPSGEDRQVVDVEVDCQRGRVAGRKTTEEMIQESIQKILAPLRRF